jgi:hypothetical protein
LPGATYLDRLENGVHDSGQARRLLRLFEETLELMQAHREMILRALQ